MNAIIYSSICGPNMRSNYGSMKKKSWKESGVSLLLAHSVCEICSIIVYLILPFSRSFKSFLSFFSTHPVITLSSFSPILSFFLLLIFLFRFFCVPFITFYLQNVASINLLCSFLYASIAHNHVNQTAVNAYGNSCKYDRVSQ